MVMYLGETTGPVWRNRLRELGWGRLWIMLTPRDRYEGEPLAIDNGVFSAWRKGEEWDGGRFQRYVETVATDGFRPDFAVLPDVVGDARRSLDQSWRWLDQFPENWPLYLALQDGMRPLDLLPFQPCIAGVFLGGTDRFKATARDWCGWAHENGLRFHFARASTPGRLRAGIEMGADSADSVQPMWSLRDLTKAHIALRRTEQGSLFDPEPTEASA